MKRLHLDFETFSQVDITKEGAYRYAMHPSTKVLMAAYALSDGKVHHWDATKKPMPTDLKKWLDDPEVEIHAFNANFERLIITHVLKLSIPLSRYRCTMVHAFLRSFVGGLSSVGAELGIAEDKAKLKEGKALIKVFCVPRKPTKSKPYTQVTEAHAPDKWQQFVQYNIQDVEAERAVWKMLNKHPVEIADWEDWFLDQLINDNGLPIDEPLVKAAIELAERDKAYLMGELERLTDLDNPNSREQLLGWLQQHCDIPDLTKNTVAEYAGKEDLDEAVREVLNIRKLTSKSSVSKFAAIRRCTQAGRVYGTLQFAGAQRTGRWAGRLIQPQNFIRPPRGYDAEDSIDLIMRGGHPEDLAHHLTAALRGCIASSGKNALAIADLAGIEGRVLPWLCNFQKKLTQIKNGMDMYLVAASAIYGIPYEKLTDKSPERTPGKVAELALGYQGSIGALNQMAAAYGLTPFEEDEGLEIVRAWRQANKPITQFWYNCQSAFRQALGNKKKEVIVENLAFFYDGEFLLLILPSNRKIYYHKPEVGENNLSYMGWNSVKRKWERIDTYGGKLVENATQAMARDILMENMHHVHAAGFKIVGSVHDELLTEQPKTRKHNHENLAKLMTKVPEWAEGLPLGASGYTERRYKK